VSPPPSRRQVAADWLCFLAFFFSDMTSNAVRWAIGAPFGGSDDR
jgi:hypothetical protein